MSALARILAMVCAGALAAFVLKALGVPCWRDGLSLNVIGDQADGFMMAAFLVFALTSRSKQP